MNLFTKVRNFFIHIHYQSKFVFSKIIYKIDEMFPFDPCLLFFLCLFLTQEHIVFPFIPSV